MLPFCGRVIGVPARRHGKVCCNVHVQDDWQCAGWGRSLSVARVVRRSTQRTRARMTRGVVLDRLTYVGGGLLPLFTLPQAARIWLDGKAEGVSLTTWTAYLVVSVLFVIHGVRHRLALLLVTYLPFVVIEVAIIAGVLAA
jgi:uncharacterized protein with PQ loop repeat